MKLCCYNCHWDNDQNSKASLWSLKYKNTHLEYYIQKGLVMLLQCNYNITVTICLNKMVNIVLNSYYIGQNVILLKKKNTFPCQNPFQD